MGPELVIVDDLDIVEADYMDGHLGAGRGQKLKFKVDNGAAVTIMPDRFRGRAPLAAQLNMGRVFGPAQLVIMFDC